MDILEYIKVNYPNIIYNKNPKSNIVGFFIDEKIVLGYIKIPFTIYKITNPIDLGILNETHFIELLKNIPKIETVDTFDLSEIQDIVNKNDLIYEMEFYIKNPGYTFIPIINNNDILLIKQEYYDKLKLIKDEYKNKLQRIELNNLNSKDKLIYEKSYIIDLLKNYRENLDNFLNTQDFHYLSIINSLEKDLDVVQDKLSNLLELEENKLDNLTEGTDYDYRLNQKQLEIDFLNKNIISIKKELDNIKDDYSEYELKNILSKKYKSKCLDYILKEKDTIIYKIKDYTKEWLKWSENNNYSIEDYRNILGTELESILKNFNKLKENNLKKNKNDIKLNQYLNEIKNELKKSVNLQLISMSIKDTDSNTEQEVDFTNLSDLKDELLKSKYLLDKNYLNQNNLLKKKNKQDFEIFQNFIIINNIFYRKKQIIETLDKIIIQSDFLDLFTNLTKNITLSIKDKYIKTRVEIFKHFDFLNISKYINDPNILLFKSESTVNKIPKQFILDLLEIIEYWKFNLNEFNIQNQNLINIIEDLLGFNRIYIKIKPLIGNEKISDFITVNAVNENQITIENAVTLEKQDFGDFYKIFNEKYSNLDIITGIENSSEALQSKYPCLLDSFNLIKEGYSIILSEYSSDKILFGSTYYGLSSLENVKNIKIKNIFEQYISKFNLDSNRISGNIYHLFGNIIQFDNVSVNINENDDFKNFLPTLINLNNINLKSLQTLFNVIENYRISKNRIKRTPNKKTNNRSNLFIVFEILFENGEIGFLTISELADPDTPKDIFNLFIESNEININSLNINTIDKYTKQDLRKDYTSDYIYNLFKESFYINETLNHFIYFLNKKNYNKIKISKQIKHSYNPELYYLDPLDEEKYIEDTYTSNNILTIPIMNYLDNLSKNNTSKYIGIINLPKNNSEQLINNIKFSKKCY